MCRFPTFLSVILAAVVSLGVADALLADAQARTHGKVVYEKTAHEKTAPEKTRHGKSSHAEDSHAKSGHDKTAHARNSQEKTARDKTDHGKTAHAKTAHAKAAERKAAERKAEEAAETKAAKAKAAAAEAAEAKAAEAKAAEANAAKAKAVAAKAAAVSAQTESQAASATASRDGQNCPGNPQALGTSRVLTIEPGTYSRLGLMQYPQTLPLADKEVVLTFDDGPLPPASNHVLDILDAQCVKATFFLVGNMAHYFPSVVRRVYAAGHTIGTHSEDHPPRFEKLPIGKVRYEIDRGIADVDAALGEPNELAPFFRIPGLGRTNAIEQELAARSLVVFSVDVVADDWFHRITPSEIASRAVSRLEKRGKGILLLHDIHQRTALALPALLKQLKDQGFHIVHVVPAAAGRIATVNPSTLAPVGSMPSWSANRGDANWPNPVVGAPAQRAVLPAPNTEAFDTGYRPWRPVVVADGTDGTDTIAAAAGTDSARWPGLTESSDAAPPSSGTELPAPSLQDIGIPLEGLDVVGEAIEPRPNLAATGAGEADTAASPTTSRN